MPISSPSIPCTLVCLYTCTDWQIEADTVTRVGSERVEETRPEIQRPLAPLHYFWSPTVVQGGVTQHPPQLTVHSERICEAEAKRLVLGVQQLCGL